MADAMVEMRGGEKRPVYGQATAQSGTLTIQASPAPSCTLYDSAGAAVSGFGGIPATGYDPGAVAAPRAWLNLDTAGLAAGFYTLVFTFTAAGSDGITRVYRPAAVIQIAAA